MSTSAPSTNAPGRVTSPSLSITLNVANTADTCPLSADLISTRERCLCTVHPSVRARRSVHVFALPGAGLLKLNAVQAGVASHEDVQVAGADELHRGVGL